MAGRDWKVWPWEKISRHFISTLILLVTLYLAATDRTASATVMASLFIVTHLLTNIDKLKSFGAFGVTAELREVIKEAQLTVEQARRMAITTASQTFYQYAVQGRFLGGDYRRKNELIQKLNANLIDLGVNPAEAQEARRELFEFAQYDVISKTQTHFNGKLMAHGVDLSDFPSFVTYAGDGLGAFDHAINIIVTDGRLDKPEIAELVDQLHKQRNALVQSMKDGSFTDEALHFLED